MQWCQYENFTAKIDRSGCGLVVEKHNSVKQVPSSQYIYIVSQIRCYSFVLCYVLGVYVYI